MSHEIYAFNIKKKQIAYISYGANDPFKHAIYELLNAEKYNNGLSGNGKSCSYEESEINEALQQVRKQGSEVFETCFGDDIYAEDEVKRLKSFLQNCLKATQKHGLIEIAFK